MAKYFYDLVISVFDKNGNRIEAHEDFGSCNKRETMKRRTQLKKEIKAGKYDKYANFENGETLCAEIEVHDDETYSLLWVE